MAAILLAIAAAAAAAVFQPHVKTGEEKPDIHGKNSSSSSSISNLKFFKRQYSCDCVSMIKLFIVIIVIVIVMGLTIAL